RSARAAQRLPLLNVRAKIDHARRKLLREIHRVELQLPYLNEHRELPRPQHRVAQGAVARTEEQTLRGAKDKNIGRLEGMSRKPHKGKGWISDGLDLFVAAPLGYQPHVKSIMYPMEQIRAELHLTGL